MHEEEWGKFRDHCGGSALKEPSGATFIIVFLVVRWRARSSFVLPQKILARGRGATEDDIPIIHSIAEKAFAPSFGISERKRLEWHREFPDGYRVLKELGTDQIIGFYTFLPLKKSAAERMVSGEILTTDIERNDICKPSRATAVHFAREGLQMSLRSLQVSESPSVSD